MKETEFNLIDEPWVIVLNRDDSMQEVSLKDVLLHAHEYKGLAGEMALQDIAVMRLLLAVLHTVFSRSDAAGNVRKICDEDDALNVWEELWKMGQFPGGPISDYLDKWHERFWLFHPKHPFCQVLEAGEGKHTFYKSAKVIGEISESNNKSRIFASRSGSCKDTISYSEGARWLLFLNDFDDCSLKPKVKLTWTGNCGLIYAIGENLFKTLMLNFVLLPDGEKCFKEDRPAWESQVPHPGILREIPMPDNQAELLTLQSRRILLERNENAITGCSIQAGDYFEGRNAFCEQMTTWRWKDKESKKNLSVPCYVPNRCSDSFRQMWRDFANDFVAIGGKKRRPGVVSWIDTLKSEGCIDEETVIQFHKISAIYGAKNASLAETYGDTLVFHTALLSHAGLWWQARIVEQIGHIDSIAKYIGKLAVDLSTAKGRTNPNNPNDKDCRRKISGQAKAEYYASIDTPFRKWLQSIDPENKANNWWDLIEKWELEAESIGVQIGKDLSSEAGPAAYVGRYIIEKGKKNGETKEYYSTSKILNRFLWQMKRVYAKEAET